MAKLHVSRARTPQGDFCARAAVESLLHGDPSRARKIPSPASLAEWRLPLAALHLTPCAVSAVATSKRLFPFLSTRVRPRIMALTTYNSWQSAAMRSEASNQRARASANSFTWRHLCATSLPFCGRSLDYIVLLGTVFQRHPLALPLARLCYGALGSTWCHQTTTIAVAMPEEM